MILTDKILKITTTYKTSRRKIISTIVNMSLKIIVFTAVLISTAASLEFKEKCEERYVYPVQNLNATQVSKTLCYIITNIFSITLFSTQDLGILFKDTITV